jgi:hypothetical protein
MNKIISSLALALFTVAIYAQDPPGCAKTTTHKHLKAQKSEAKAKRQVLDLRSKKHRTQETGAFMPVIASPIYVPQGNDSSTAITASGGYLYVVQNNTIFKVSEKTLQTVQVATLGTRKEPRTTADKPRKKKRIVADSEHPKTRNRSAAP